VPHTDCSIQSEQRFTYTVFAAQNRLGSPKNKKQCVSKCKVVPGYKISWVYYNTRTGNLTLQIRNVETFHHVDMQDKNFFPPKKLLCPPA